MATDNLRDISPLHGRSEVKVDEPRNSFPSHDTMDSPPPPPIPQEEEPLENGRIINQTNLIVIMIDNSFERL